ncbi:MAG: TonB-dependent receptor, partial [Planctomycetes bacterium]|nr:TonB-dependent receptor [Planctomycetota bacterium]
MLKKMFILSFFLLCISSLAFGGVTGKIAGKVTDLETGEVLPGTNVKVVEDEEAGLDFEEIAIYGSAAGTDGGYVVHKLPPGVYMVEATMMGYAKLTKTGVHVSADRMILIDFELKPTTLEGEEITVVAKRDVVELDVSASQFSATGEQISEVPLVVHFQDYVGMQAGVDGDEIRGGGMDQTGLLVDGLPMIDSQTNEPIMLVNLSAVQEVNVIKGGFSAEYGNIRSGMVNVVTKEGKRRYHGSVDFRFTPAEQKHRGASIFDPDNYSLRPYLDPAVCWVGTANGRWDEYTQSQNIEFEGWHEFVEDNPEYGLTPEGARDLFIWQHRAAGSEELGHPYPGKYGNDPDYDVDLGFGGPIPFIGKYLGDMTFFTSYRTEIIRPIFPAAREQSTFYNGMLKLTTRLSSSMKLGIQGSLAKTEESGGGDFPEEDEEEEGMEIEGVDRGRYFMHGDNPMDVDNFTLGLTFDHVLSPTTFYNVRISMVSKKNEMWDPAEIRDDTILRTFGNVQMDERPWGYYATEGGYQYSIADMMVIGGVGGAGKDRSKVKTINAKFDYTSQLGSTNEIKAGLEINYDDFDMSFGEDGLDPTDNYWIEWQQSPIRYG